MINQTHTLFLRLIALVFILLIGACTDGDRGFVPLPVEEEEEKLADIRIVGAGVKGPLINAEVSIYRLELDKGDIHEFNVALKRWYELLEENDVTINGSLATAGSISASEVVANIKLAVNQYGFTTELDRLKTDLDEAETFSQADSLVTNYIENLETNTKVRDQINKLQDEAATLADYQSGIKEISSLTDKVMEADDFSSARSILLDYKAKETDQTKKAGFDSAIAALDNYRSKSSSFGVAAIRTAYENDIYEVFLPRFDVQNAPYSRQNLINLDAQLAESDTVNEAKTYLEQGLAKEFNPELKAAISSLISRITTVDDLKQDLLGRESMYHKFGIRTVVDDASASDLQRLYEEVSLRLSQDLEQAFRNSLIVEDEEDDGDEFAENLLSFGVTNEQGLLPGLLVNQYRGFVYMEVKSVAQTVDLNSGRPPIVSKLESIFHTDDITGNGAENSEDQTVYFVLNGIVQRDQDGKLITDRDEIEATSADELLEVRPFFTATPFTQLGVQVVLEKLKTLMPFTSDANNDGIADKMISKDVLSSALDDASNLIVESLGIGMQAEHNIFRTPAVRMPEMKYDKQAELAAIQHRYSIENFSAFIQALKSRKNLSGQQVLAALSQDLVDNQLDAQAFDSPVNALAGIPEYTFLLTSDPAEKFIPDTTIPVSDTYYVMNDELSITQPDHPLSGFNAKRNEVASNAPKGGRDSDGDSVLDNEDDFPSDPLLSRALSPGYPGIWSLVFDDSDYLYMPFNANLQFALNKQQIEGVCSNSPCIGLGNTAAELSARYDLIKAPADHDFSLTAFDQNSTIGFSAFATVPGNYLVKATYQASAASPQLRYQIIVPIQVINPRSIELKFNPEVPVPGKTTKVQFKATKALCALYDFCGDLGLDLTDDIPDYVDISLLSEVFSVEQTLNRNGVKFSYSSVESSGADETNISNIELNDRLDVTVRFSAGSRTFIAKSTDANSGGTNDRDADGVADTLDFFPDDANCAREKDGILDTNFDGEINNLDQASCFASFFQEDSQAFDVNFLNETWYYNTEWDYIIRKNKFQTGFNGHILLPTRQGTKQTIEKFLVDNVSKRVYFGYQNAEIDYFQLESQEIVSFDAGVAFARIHSLHLVGSYLLAEYDLGDGQMAAKLFNKSGKLAQIQGADQFPKPRAAINLTIDGRDFLSATNNLLSLNWQIERNGPANKINPQLSNDRVTLLEGQTVYGDVIKLQLSFVAEEDRLISLSEDIFVLNFDEIGFTTEDFFDDKPITLLFENYDSSLLPSNSQLLFVNWYINGENTENFVFSFSDFSYPFILDSTNFNFGDMIRAEIMLKHGNESVLVAEKEIVVLGDLNELLPEIDEQSVRDDLANLDFYFELAELTSNKQFFNSETFRPVWKINGAVIQGENGVKFPQLSSTRFKYGDEITVSYTININGRSLQTDDVLVASILLDSSASTFKIQPKVADLGQSLSLDTSAFTDDVLGGIEAKWRINSVVDTSISAFTYPADKLQYGDSVELLIVPLGAQIESAFNHIAKAAVGLNLFSLNQVAADPEHDLDSDLDSIPNRQDFFRNDASCSAVTEGSFDDIDRDGLSDLDEIKLHGTDPNSSDTDNDGLSDWAEINTHSTNPNNADSDADGYRDGVEIDLDADPLDPASPNPVSADNDFDGLPNEGELLAGTKVNRFDTDTDGLSDWFEINKSNTDPLKADTDEDGLSDGLELRVTKTDPLKADSDDDTLSDGQEVLLGLNPLLADSDDNTINDPDETGYDFSQQLTGILYIADLPDYRVIPDHRLRVETGTCYSTFIGQNKPELVSYSHVTQTSASSQQQVAFASSEWAQVLRYDARNKVYLPAIDLAGYPQAALTSLEYDVADINKLYLGFSDGRIRLFNASNGSIADLYQAEQGVAVDKLLDQGGLLLAEQLRNGTQVVHSAFNKASTKSTASATWNAEYSYKHATWQDSTRTTLLVVDKNNNPMGFVRERFDSGQPSNPLTQVDLIASPTAVNGPLFVETISASKLLRFGSGHSYNLSSSSWLNNRLAPFSYGLSHQAHRVVALKNSSLLEMTTLSTLDDTQYWRLTTQLDRSELIAVVPVGFHLLAVTSTAASGSQSPKTSFQTILLGDSDGNQMPDWWQRLSPNLTPADFTNYRFTGNVNVPDYLNGDADIDVTVQPPLSIDSDNDGICDVWENNLFGTDYLKPDTDNDGASDAQELGIEFTTPLDCKIKPKYSRTARFVSDPLKPDTDNDGLKDGYEHFQSFTNPLLIDTDGDGLTDYQEVNITGTNPLVANSSTDSDGDGLSDADELNLFNTNHLLKDTDDDGIEDKDEVSLYGTNPNSKDTDGDGLEDNIELNPVLPYLNPSDANYAIEIEKYKTNPAKRDTDGDGLTDDVELNLIGEHAFNTYPTIKDSDGDGLTDKEEFDFIFAYSDSAEGIPGDVLRTLNPREKDTDGDGICDVWEVTLLQTNPAEPDTDFDDLLDAEELGIIEVHGNIQAIQIDCTVAPQISPIANVLQRDTDNDGLFDGHEVKLLNTDPKDRDSDDNGIIDGNEDSDGDGLTDSQELYISLSDPNNPDENNNGKLDGSDDFDGDGLSNISEINTSKTDPRNPDTNGNGINDKDEIDMGLDPIKEDSDDDGITDIEEIAAGTDPRKPDSDGDGLSDGEEKTKRTLPLNPDTDHDFLNDGDDDAPLNADADGDGIPDGIEEKLGTDPRDSDSDNDGIADGDEAWVFAFEVTPGATPQDPPVVTNNFLQVGITNAKEALNNRKDQANWPKHNAPESIKFEDNGLDRRVYDLYDMADNTRIIAKLYVRMFSNPAKPDTDGDGLTDATELSIETRYGNRFDLSAPGTNNTFYPLKSNAENFFTSDPWVVDTDKNEIPDGLEDIDGDFLTNTLDQNNQGTDVLVSDTDGDGIPDGIEVLVLNTNPSVADTDSDGVSDRNELDQFSTLNDIRFVENAEECLPNEVRISNIAGKDYCVLIEYKSYPTLVDSDNDGTPDSKVNPDNTVSQDFFPLDAACHAASDGFVNTTAGRKQCFSSWMSEVATIGLIQASEWKTSGGQDRADILFYQQGWDKVIRFNTLTSRYLTAISVDPDETIVGIDTVAQSRSLFILYSTGRLDRYNLETGNTQSVDDLSQAGLTPDRLLALGNGDLLVQYKDAANLSALYLYDQNGTDLDSLSGLTVDIRENAFYCNNSACTSSGFVYAFVKDGSGKNTNLARIEINLSARVFNPNITLANTLAQFSTLNGPIRLAQDKQKVYLASGQELELNLQNSDHSENLAITHEGKTYTDFYDFLESNDHIIGIIDYDLSGMPGAPLAPAKRNGLIAEDMAYPNTYLIPPVSFEERILRLLSYSTTSTLDVAVVSKLADRILIESFGVIDMDADGMSGIYEAYYGLDDTDPSDRFNDPDADGITNIEEYRMGTDPLGDKFSDPDQDGLTNIDEHRYGTDPLNPDSDGDGYDDLEEIQEDTDPTDPASKPGN